MKNIAVFVSGSGSNLQSLIDRQEEFNGRIRLVISSVPSVYALDRAAAAKIDTAVITRKEQDVTDKILQLLERYNIDLVVLAGYLSILDTAIIDKYRYRIINVHPSLIPSFCGKGYYGLRVAKAMIERGVKVAGATVHFVDEGADTGEIILQRTIDVLDCDTPESLQKRVLENIEHKILPEAVKLFCDDKLRVDCGRVKIVE